MYRFFFAKPPSGKAPRASMPSVGLSTLRRPNTESPSSTAVPLVDVRVVLRGHHKPLALAGATVDDLEDVDELLLVREVEVKLVVVARAEVAHHMPVAVEEHHRHRVVELVHLVEVRHRRCVTRVHRRKLRHQRRRLVQQLVHLEHLPGTRVPEPDHHKSVLLRENRLVDVPARPQVWQKHRAHLCYLLFFFSSFSAPSPSSASSSVCSASYSNNAEHFLPSIPLPPHRHSTAPICCATRPPSRFVFCPVPSFSSVWIPTSYFLFLVLPSSSPSWSSWSGLIPQRACPHPFAPVRV